MGTSILDSWHCLSSHFTSFCEERYSDALAEPPIPSVKGVQGFLHYAITLFIGLKGSSSDVCRSTKWRLAPTLRKTRPDGCTGRRHPLRDGKKIKSRNQGLVVWRETRTGIKAGWDLQVDIQFSKFSIEEHNNQQHFQVSITSWLC